MSPEATAALPKAIAALDDQELGELYRKVRAEIVMRQQYNCGRCGSKLDFPGAAHGCFAAAFNAWPSSGVNLQTPPVNPPYGF